jgi:hypothetical protein
MYFTLVFLLTTLIRNILSHLLHLRTREPPTPMFTVATSERDSPEKHFNAVGSQHRPQCAPTTHSGCISRSSYGYLVLDSDLGSKLPPRSPSAKLHNRAAVLTQHLAQRLHFWGRVGNLWQTSDLAANCHYAPVIQYRTTRAKLM